MRNNYPATRYTVVHQKGPLYLNSFGITVAEDETRNSFLAQVELSRIYPEGGHQTDWVVVYNIDEDASTEEILARAFLISNKGWVIPKHRFILRRKIANILKNMELTA